MSIRDYELAHGVEAVEALQERLVRAAYGLHFAGANLANLVQARADQEPASSRDDLDGEVRHWRAASEQALTVVRAWDATVLPLPSARIGGHHQRGSVAAVADATIRDLFRVGMHLHAALHPSAGTAVRTRIADAIEVIDAIIDRLRQEGLAGPDGWQSHD